MKMLRIITLGLIIAISSCNTPHRSHLEKQYDNYFTKEQIKALNELVDVLSNELKKQYGYSINEKERLILFMNDLENGKIKNSKPTIDEKTKSKLRLELEESGLLNEIWTFSEEQKNNNDEIIDIDRNLNQSKSIDLNTHKYVPNLYGNYLLSIQSIAPNDKLVNDYLNAKRISEQLTIKQLAAGLSYSIKNEPFNEYFLMRILVAEYVIPAIISD